jgi:hypothetical protein
MCQTDRDLSIVHDPSLAGRGSSPAIWRERINQQKMVPANTESTISLALMPTSSVPTIAMSQQI